MLRMTRGYHSVNFRFIVEPSEQLTGGWLPLSATVEDIRKEISIGLKDGTEIAKKWLSENKQVSSDGGLLDALFPSSNDLL